jgi:ketosteroid isomerase-like protein
MNRIRAMSRATFVIVLFTALMAPHSLAQAHVGDENTLMQLQRDWAEARKNIDLAFLEKFYAKEFTVGTMDGAEASRAKDLSMFSSGDLKPSVIVDDQMVVHIYGQAALVTGVEHLEGSYKGHTGKFDLRFANTFVYRDGRWQIVRHQATPIVMK